MTGERDTTHGKSEAARRAERQRAALRENLKRRKAQARARERHPGQISAPRGVAPEKPKV